MTNATGAEMSKRAARHESIVGDCRSMLAIGLPKSEIKRRLRSAHKIHFRRSESYISEARAQLIADAGVSREDVFAEQMAFYRAIKADPECSALERLKAAERIDKLLGLETQRESSLTQQQQVVVVFDEQFYRSGGPAPQAISASARDSQ